MEEQLNILFQKYPSDRQDLLLPLLQEMQEESGYLSPELLRMAGEHFNLPINKVYGVATFYNQFRLIPKGKFHFKVCSGTACQLERSSSLLQSLEKLTHLQPGQTSRDGKFSIEIIHCFGACHQSPVIEVNGKFYTKMTEEKLSRLLESLTE
ncbi:MAG: NAD(P)H-dependent oxidoreductase subunit E [Bacteroidota bacterium]|nr:NAD(P)H-dependent oxidoreductase subunit E [Bacteroidota bacterium]